MNPNDVMKKERLSLKPFQPNIVFHIKIIHLIFKASGMTGFHMNATLDRTGSRSCVSFVMYHDCQTYV